MRRELSLIVAVAAAMFGCGAEEAADRVAFDAGQVADAIAEPPPDGGELTSAPPSYHNLSCDQLAAEVWKLPRECDSTNACTLIGTSCTPSWLFIAVNFDASNRARQLHDAMRKSGCGLGFDGWIPRAECISGRCVAVDTDRNCMGRGAWTWEAGIGGDPAIDGGATNGSVSADGAITLGADTLRDF